MNVLQALQESLFFQILIYVATLWILLYILLKIVHEYLFSLNSRFGEFSITITSITFFTTQCNSWFYKISNKYSNFLRIWFGIGVIVGLFLMFLGVFILAINLVWILNKPKEELVLTPMIPGVNIPNNQLPYYFLAILISTVSMNLHML